MKLFDSNPGAVWGILLGGFSTSVAYTVGFLLMAYVERYMFLYAMSHMALYSNFAVLIFMIFGGRKLPLEEKAQFIALLLLSLFLLPAAVWAYRAVG
jgi:hypothetical protein